MKSLSIQTKTVVALVIMIALMAISRAQSPFSAAHMPDFTIPALFIAGVYFRQWIVPAILIVVAVAIDNFAIFYQGVSANCITPAYSILPLAYLAVYWGATKLDSLAIQNAKQFVNVVAVVVVFTVVEWFIATTSYYAFTTAPWADFGSYVARWAPMEMLAVLTWMAVVVVAFTINHYASLISYFEPSKS